MPRIYKPSPLPRPRQSASSSTPRQRMERSHRSHDPPRDSVSAANTFYQVGTHRSPQMKDSERTPGPGAYRFPSSFAMSPMDETYARHSGYRRSSSWALNSRNKSRVADVANAYNVVPPMVDFFQQRHLGQETFDVTIATRTRINTMPPVTPTGVFVKGHGGDSPRGYGFPF
mmetsp:Transcript_69583/g.137734  ORF Transcript_69583/g.137734 Transcript_69583/m.137734 type:complete len:172 (+) Transcript_69583:76-591(+)